jgi:hypothetical protein
MARGFRARRPAPTAPHLLASHSTCRRLGRRRHITMPLSRVARYVGGRRAPRNFYEQGVQRSAPSCSSRAPARVFFSLRERPHTGPDPQSRRGRLMESFLPEPRDRRARLPRTSEGSAGLQPSATIRVGSARPSIGENPLLSAAGEGSIAESRALGGALVWSDRRGQWRRSSNLPRSRFQAAWLAVGPGEGKISTVPRCGALVRRSRRTELVQRTNVVFPSGAYLLTAHRARARGPASR